MNTDLDRNLEPWPGYVLLDPPSSLACYVTNIGVEHGRRDFSFRLH